jgi:hypothetical protein
MHLAMGHRVKLATIFLRCIPAFFRSRNEQVIVELALRQQLATFSEKGCRPRITPADRGFWVFLSRVWSVADLVGMEGDPGHRSARNRGSLASQGISAVLAIDLETRTRSGIGKISPVFRTADTRHSDN